jgi:hypothetical protein
MRRSAQARFLAVEHLDAVLESAEAEGVQTLPKPDELSWWDWAVFLLQTAAEIEHALMVQYLYAAYSLDGAGGTGPDRPTDAAAKIGRWRAKITSIAREEMGHLLTEQNLLRFIGGPLNFEREDFPFRSTLYPFPLELQPLSKTSLAKYVCAEMPESPGVPDLDEIVARATAATGGMRPNRVGVVFETLHDIFFDHQKIVDADLRPATADQQAQPGDWHGGGRIIVRVIASRQDALDALQLIGEQGEGSANPPTEARPSHFEEFHEIFGQFPETELARPGWVPTTSIPTNPTTASEADPDPDAERGRITHPTTRLWAQLLNVRYRMLLVDIAHAMQLSGRLVDPNGAPTPRGHLRDWAFDEMHGPTFNEGVRGIARLLTTRPAKATAAPGDPANAGAPFELPYTLAIPDDEHGRWRLHRALLDASDALRKQLVDHGESDPLLGEIKTMDDAVRAIVQPLLEAS